MANEDVMPALACRHNLLYWRNHDYLGIGPGAHSHLRTPNDDGGWHERRWGNRKPVPGYTRRLRAGEPVEEFSEQIDPRLAMGETMMLGLRLVREGVRFDDFLTLHSENLADVFAVELSRLQSRALIEMDTRHVCLSRTGLMLGNQVFAEFLPG